MSIITWKTVAKIIGLLRTLTHRLQTNKKNTNSQSDHRNMTIQNRCAAGWGYWGFYSLLSGKIIKPNKMLFSVKFQWPTLRARLATGPGGLSEPAWLQVLVDSQRAPGYRSWWTLRERLAIGPGGAHCGREDGSSPLGPTWLSVRWTRAAGSGPAAGDPGPRSPNCWPPTSPRAWPGSPRGGSTRRPHPSILTTGT